MKKGRRQVIKQLAAPANTRQGHRLKASAGEYYPEWTDVDSWGWVFAYMGKGAIEVLPEDGMVNLCYDVFQDEPATYAALTGYYEDGDYTEMMEEVQTMMQYVYNATFNCYYAFEE